MRSFGAVGDDQAPEPPIDTSTAPRAPTKFRVPRPSEAGAAWVTAIAALLTAAVGALGALQLMGPGQPGASVQSPPASVGLSVVVTVPPPSLVALTATPPTTTANPTTTTTPSAAGALTLAGLTDLMMIRAAEAGLPAGTMIDRYVAKSGLGLTTDIPATWDLGEESFSSWIGGVDTVQGSALIATPDLDGFSGETQDTFSVPGLFLAGSEEMARDFEPKQLLDRTVTYYARRCTVTDRGAIGDHGYTGLFELYGDCASRTVLALNLELLAADRSHVLDMHIRLLSQSELPAVRRIFSTLSVAPTRLVR
jgi:hypothetical protein